MEGGGDLSGHLHLSFAACAAFGFDDGVEDGFGSVCGGQSVVKLSDSWPGLFAGISVASGVSRVGVNCDFVDAHFSP